MSKDEAAAPDDRVVPKPPLRARLARAIAARAALLIVLGYVYFAYAWFGPADLDATGQGYLLLWYAAFLARTFLFHAGLAFVVVAVLMTLLRRFRLVLACVPLIAVGVGPVLPMFFRSDGKDARPDLTLISFNLLYTHDQAGPLVNEVLAADADIVLLQEYTPIFDEAFAPALSDRYPYSIREPVEDAFGAAIYSKLPFVDGSTHAGAVGLGVLSAPCVAVRVKGREITLHDVHFVPPRFSALPHMRRQFAALVGELKDQAGKLKDAAGEEEDRPSLSIVAGDFNFTARSTMNRVMLGLGFTDAQESAGVGRGTTWPNIGPYRHFPGIRIDHVYLSEGLTATSCRVGNGHGSDHRPVIVGVRVEPE